MAWPLDQGKVCNTLGECSPSMAEVAALSAQQRAKYLVAGTPRSSLRRRDPEETKAETEIKTILASGCRRPRADALPHLCEIEKYF